MSEQRSLGRYRLLLPLEKGGMGQVWLALLPGPFGFRKLVVVKELRPELVASSQFREMFLGEARLAARLTHPNVVQVMEVGEDEGCYYIAMEYLEGESLRTALARRTLPVVICLDVVSQVLAGLHYAHRKTDFDGTPLAIVHRDVTPDNVFLTSNGHAKVLDFGIAKATLSSNETGANQLKGKPAYMSPEHVRGEVLDARTDVFAVGVMLWELLAGRPMWLGEADMSIVYRLGQAQIPALPEHIRGPTTLRQICTRAVAPYRQDRYESALQFREQIDRVRHSLTGDSPANDLGQYVAAIFGDTLAARRKAVEAELGALREQEGPKLDDPKLESGEQRYDLQVRVHRGASDIYRARHNRLDREVIVKRYRMAIDQLELQRRLGPVAGLVDPHTVPIIDVGTARSPDPSVFVVREHFHGVTLTSRLAQTGHLPQHEALTLAHQILMSLHEAHEAGVTHGRLCPQHVLLTLLGGSDHVRVLDYESERLGVPATNEALAYAPPDVRAESPARPQADIQSVAMMTYVMLSGRAPAWDAPDWSAVSVSESLKSTVEAALTGRFDSARRFAEALDQTRSPQRKSDAVTTSIRTVLGRHRYEALADRRPTLWFLTDPAGALPSAVEEVWSELGTRGEVTRMNEAARRLALDRLSLGDIDLPWVIVFSDLHVVLGEPLLDLTRHSGEVSRMLISTHANYELLENTVNVSGLDRQLCLPLSKDDLLAAIDTLVGTAKQRRRHFDLIRAQIRAERSRVESLTRAIAAAGMDA